MLLATTVGTYSEMKLPAGDPDTDELFLYVHIRDTLNCVNESTIGTVTVQRLQDEVYNIVDWVNASKVNPRVDLENVFREFREIDLNRQAQIYTSFSRLMNDVADERIKTAIESMSTLFSARFTDEL